MPDGVVVWFDRSAGEARIKRRGRQFVARAADVEPPARHPGARVHFDIQRDGGTQTAVGVRLRGGMRTSRHHRRFATLVGARRFDTKGAAPFAAPHVEQGLALAGHPLQVAGTWARWVAAGDVDHALALYGPSARLYTDGDALTGARHLGSRLRSLPVFGRGRVASVRGEDGLVVVRWDPIGPAEPGLSARFRIEHGQIAEQWIGTPGPELTATFSEQANEPMTLAVLTRGEVGQEAVEYARQRIGHLAKLVEEPILFARVKLGMFPDPARKRPAFAQALLDVNGRVVRAHVAAHQMHEAVDLLQRRVQDKLEHKAEHLEALRRHTPGRAEPGEWRHGDLATARPEYFDRPIEERQLVRHKAFVAGELTVDEAIFDLDQLDYAFYLFRELASGEDSLLEHLDDGTYRLQHLHPPPGTRPVTAGASTVAIDDAPAPQLTVEQAIERLNAGGEPFVFFASSASGRGAVLYRRYDGHYGVITLEEPAAG